MSIITAHRILWRRNPIFWTLIVVGVCALALYRTWNEFRGVQKPRAEAVSDCRFGVDIQNEIECVSAFVGSMACCVLL